MKKHIILAATITAAILAAALLIYFATHIKPRPKPEDLFRSMYGNVPQIDLATPEPVKVPAF